MCCVPCTPSYPPHSKLAIIKRQRNVATMKESKGGGICPLSPHLIRSPPLPLPPPLTPRPNDVQDLQQACNINEPKHGQTM